MHAGETPLVLVNIWDPGSARTVAAAGAAALATGSASVGGALGYGDKEAVPLDVVLAHAARIAASVELPVSVDFEAGYAATPDGLTETVRRLVATGAVGVNLEDGYPAGDGEGLRPLADAAARLRAARAAADSVLPGFWINARTDICLQAKPETHGAHLADSDCPRQGLCRGRGEQFLRAGAEGYRAHPGGVRGEPVAGEHHGGAGGGGLRGSGGGGGAAHQLWPIPMARSDGNAHFLCSGGG